MQQNVRRLSEPAEGEGMSQFVDENGDEHDHDPNQDHEQIVRTGTKQDGDQPEQWMYAHRDACDGEAQVKAGWGSGLEHNSRVYHAKNNRW